MDDVSNPEFADILTVLGKIETMLIDNDLPKEADTVALLMDLAKSDPPLFTKQLRTGTIWGSSGSIVDVLFTGNRGDDPEDLLRLDVEYHRLVADLAESMEKAGIGTERASSIGASFRRWVEHEDRKRDQDQARRRPD